MHFYQAFDQTIKEFDLNIHEIVTSSGISSSRLRLFRGGFDTRIDTVEKLIAAMPMAARRYCMELMFLKRLTHQPTLHEELVDALPGLSYQEYQICRSN